MSDGHLRLVTSERSSTAAQARAIEKRAARAGYRLVGEPNPSDLWHLLDAEDGACLYSGNLNEIERWLDT